MCDGPISPNIHEFMPHHHIKPRRMVATDLWPNANIHRHVTAVDLWPNNSVPEGSDDPIIPNSFHLNDASLHRLVKRTRTANEFRWSNWTTVEAETQSSSFTSINLLHTRWSMNAERLLGSGTPNNENKKETDLHNNDSENRSAGKRKMCDLNVNLSIGCMWPSLPEASDEEDSDGASDSGSDSEGYSGPS